MNEQQCRKYFTAQLFSGPHSSETSPINLHRHPPRSNQVAFGEKVTKRLFPAITPLDLRGKPYKLRLVYAAVSYGPSGGYSLFVARPTQVGGIYLNTPYCDVIYTYRDVVE